MPTPPHAPWAALASLAAVLVLTTACQTPAAEPAPAFGPASEFRESPVAQEPSVAPRTAVTASLETVYFDYDEATLRPDARPILQRNAKRIEQHPEWGTVSIEGHCDERGSDEYNMALGERRAMQVKSYLVDLGVQNARLRTVTFGEARPAVQGYTEEAFRHNRRSEFSLSEKLASSR